MDFPSRFPLWGKLSAAQRQFLRDSAILLNVKKGGVVHKGNGECTGPIIVEAGQLRAYFLSRDGREITLYRLREGDMCLFSAPCILNGVRFEIAVEAEKDSSLWRVAAMAYKKLMEESAAVSNYTNEVMAARFSDVMWLVEQIMWKSFDKRLAEFLLEESALEGGPVLNTTHEAVGRHLGNPREVVTRMLRYFQSEGAVCLARGSIKITDYKKLEAVVKRH